MNETGRPDRRPDPTMIPPATIAPRSACLSGLQATLAIFDAELEALRAVCSPREFAVLLDLFRRRLDRELERDERALRRWAA
jgi:hypothetical protein